MSTPMADTPKRRRARRRFDDDFKAQAVRLVLDEGKSVGAVARDLDLTETALRAWVHRARANRTRGRTVWLLKIPYVLPPLMFGSFLDTLRAHDFHPGLGGPVGAKLASVARGTA